MAVPYTFANVLGGSSIPLSQLDDNFDYLTASPSFSGNVTITGTLGVGGAVTFSSTLNVTGITTLSNNLNVAGSSTFTGGATFSSSVTFDSKTITGTTGTGNFVLAVSPTITSATLVAPALGTPTSGDLVNCTNLPLSSVTGLGTGVESFLAIPSSANLSAAVTGETGSGALVFGTNPVLVTPNIGTPSAGVLTNCTGLPLTTGITGTLPVANGGTGITSFGSGIATWLGTPSSANLAAALTDETGSGSAVFANSPTLVTPVLGTPNSGTLTNCTGLPLNTGITGVLPVANGGTGISSLTTGYIPFGGATTFSSDSNLFWDNTGKRLGIGTSLPAYKLDVAGDIRGQKAAGAGWGIVTNTATISNESGIYFDASENAQFDAKDGLGATQIRWQTANDTSNLVGGLPAFVCRAWVNFNAVTQTIRGNGNVSSITYNSTGNYSINLTTVMPDTNAAVISSCEITGAAQENTTSWMEFVGAPRVETRDGATLTDAEWVSVAVFR